MKVILRLGARSSQPGLPVDAAQKLDMMIRAHMKDLKATKIAREGDQPKGQQTTPADWATELLEKTGGKKAQNIRKSTKGKEKQKDAPKED